MKRPKVLTWCAVVLAWLTVAAGCSAPEPGWRRLWTDEWDLHHHGDHWVRGVPAMGRAVTSSEPGSELRMDLLNTGGETVEVRVSGRGFEKRWRLEPGQYQPVDVDLGPGEVRIEAPAEVVLGSPRIGRRVEEPRLLVVIVIDTLRADHVTRELMPGVTAFFADGRRWRAATANAPWTLPSVASTFTSRPVLELTTPEGEIAGIPAGLETWPTALHEAGFEGGAVVANYTVHTLNGFAGGFSSFQVPDGHGPEIAPDASWVAEAGRRWISSHRGEDAFVYLHFMDPHEPYRSHDGTGTELPPLQPLARRQREAGLEEAALLRERYAGEVSYVDGIVSAFLDELPPNAAVVLTSDHGEGLGEHGAWAHGPTLYQEALAVPLMARGPGVLAGDALEPAQLLDLAPTLLDMVDRDPADGFVGRSLLAGGSAEPIVSVTYSAGPLRWAWREANRKVVMRMTPQPHLGAEVRRPAIEAAPLPPGAFFVDLTVDPGEDHPGPVPDAFAHRVAEVFARTAGTTAPGMQVFAWRVGSTEVVLECERQLELAQAWSPSEIAVSQRDGRFTLRCSEDAVMCAVTAGPESVPATVTPVETGPRWWGIAAGEPVDPRALDLPNVGGPGVYLWWNPERPLVVGGYDETLERLRALGYVD
ncbi:MAG: sulfatase [Candidatus Sulfomarinibacteraceae bacterium]